MRKSKARHKYLKWPSSENYVKYKEIIEFLSEKVKSKHFKNITTNKNERSKPFWDIVKAFMPSKGALTNGNISMC